MMIFLASTTRLELSGELAGIFSPDEAQSRIRVSGGDVSGEGETEISNVDVVPPDQVSKLTSKEGREKARKEQALQREFGFGSRDLKHMDVNELAVAARGLAAFLRAKGYDVDSEASETDSEDEKPHRRHRRHQKEKEKKRKKKKTKHRGKGEEREGDEKARKKKKKKHKDEKSSRKREKHSSKKG